jgi:hypothetical protein
MQGSEVTLILVDIMISNGSDTDRYRDVAAGVLDMMGHMLLYQLNVPLSLTNWDYRRDPPAVVPAGQLAARSLEMVERSQALLAIFGRRVPRVTCLEIRRAFERRQAGHTHPVWVFVNPKTKTDKHQEFFDQIKHDFGEEIIHAPYTDRLSFQSKVFTTIMPHLLAAGRQGFGPTEVVP